MKFMYALSNSNLTKQKFALIVNFILAPREENVSCVEPGPRSQGSYIAGRAGNVFSKNEPKQVTLSQNELAMLESEDRRKQKRIFVKPNSVMTGEGADLPTLTNQPDTGNMKMNH
jgi:hypothetical protein